MGRPDSGHGVDVHFAIALPNSTTLPATREAGLVQISSAVSTVLRVHEFPVAGAAGAEHCGYGDLQ